MNKEELKNLSGKMQTLGGKIFTKSHFKKLGVFLVICAVAAGGGAYFVHQQKITKRLQVNEARTAMITAQATKSNISLLPENQIRTLAAQAIGQDESNITFREIYLSNDHDRYEDNHDGHKLDKDHDRYERDHDDHDKDHDRHKIDKDHKKHRDEHRNDRYDGTTHATDKRSASSNMTSAPILTPVQPATSAQPTAPAEQQNNMTASAVTPTNSPMAQPVMNQMRNSDPVYKVKCNIGSVKYRLYIDAVNGNVLSSKIG